MDMCRVSLEGPSICEQMVVHEVQAEARCSSTLSKMLCRKPIQFLYGPTRPMIRNEMIDCVLFSAEQFSSRSYLEVVQSASW